MPVFSVITPVFNGAAHILRCHAMLANQTFSDWEWIVVDDGSNDETADIVRAIDDARIRLLSYRPNRGRGYARHQALDAATGDWMVVWDADDMYFPDRLAVIDEARRAGFDFCCSYAVVVDNELRVKGVRGFHPPARGLPRHFVHHTLGCSMEIARLLGYDPTLRTGEDATITWVLDQRYRGLFIEDALTIYQEEIDIGAAKALATVNAQIAQLRKIVPSGLLRMSAAKYTLLIARLQLKRAVLQLMRLAPFIYRATIPLRSYGETAPGYVLSEARVAFIAQLKRQWPSQGGRG